MPAGVAVLVPNIGPEGKWANESVQGQSNWPSFQSLDDKWLYQWSHQIYFTHDQSLQNVRVQKAGVDKKKHEPETRWTAFGASFLPCIQEPPKVAFDHFFFVENLAESNQKTIASPSLNPFVSLSFSWKQWMVFFIFFMSFRAKSVVVMGSPKLETPHLCRLLLQFLNSFLKCCI